MPAFVLETVELVGEGYVERVGVMIGMPVSERRRQSIAPCVHDALVLVRGAGKDRLVSEV